MKYLKFTYVDAQTGISIAAQPAQNGPKFPPVVGLSFVWARESAYPTDVPQFFGTCPDDADTQIDGVLGIFGQADWEQMQADEMAKRAQPPSIKTIITDATQKRLDDFARTKGYDNIVSACSYATSESTYGGEGKYCVGAREETWDTVFAIQAEVEAGTRPIPKNYAEIEPLLPPLAWPQ